MDLIAVIRDADLGFKYRDRTTYKNRCGVRAVIRDSKNRVALVHVTNRHYYKLPGGGIKTGEGALMALRREVREEVGSDICNIRPLGVIEEVRSKKGNALHQVSYFFTCDLAGAKGVPHFQHDEVAEGSTTVWVSLALAIKKLKQKSIDYRGRFATARDFIIIERYSQSRDRERA